MKTEPIRIWNRRAAREDIELVYGDAPLRWAYTTTTGQTLANRVLSRAAVSRFYGTYQSSRWSTRAIEPFIAQFGLKMEEYEGGPYSSFNEFFIRKFKPGMRPFAPEAPAMPAFAEGRYLAYESVAADQGIPVKGKTLAIAGLLGDAKLAEKFEKGPLFVSRLCPVDYHRFHFPDAGKIEKEYRVTGRLHSVNPLALQYDPRIFVTNERHVSILETQNFGTLAYVEVGALCVGRIVQSHSPEKPFKRGDEKGYFLFGASTVILLGQPGRWKPDADLLERTSKGQETLVLLGDKIAHA